MVASIPSVSEAVKPDVLRLENIPSLQRFLALNQTHWEAIPSSKEKLLVCVYPSPPAITAAGLMIQAIAREKKLEPIAYLNGSVEQ